MYFNEMKKTLTVSKYMTIPIFIFVTGLMVIGFGLSVEDYMSSYNGYKLIPTRKSFDWVVYLVAAIPQLLSVVSAYIYAESLEIKNGLSKGSKGALLVFLVAVFLDVITDTYYKASGLDFRWWIVAFLESVFVYTIGSDLLFTYMFGLWAQMLPDAMKIMGFMSSSSINGVINGFNEFVGNLFNDNNNRKGGNNQYQRKN